jgi:hypothetical protein
MFFKRGWVTNVLLFRCLAVRSIGSLDSVCERHSLTIEPQKTFIEFLQYLCICIIGAHWGGGGG